MAERHAELPWNFSPWHIEEGPSAVRCSTGYLVCETAGDADAKLIVKAVNNHDHLVKALEASCGYLLNAKIDLETGCTKATAIKTIEGGLLRAKVVLALVGETR